MIKTTNLTKIYRSDEVETTALNEVNRVLLDVENQPYSMY